MRAWRLILALPVGWAVVAACSSFDEDAAPEAADAAQGDGSQGDAAPPDSATADSATADSGPPRWDGGLLPNGGFEELGPGCGLGWVETVATLARDSFAKDGTYSCRICVPSGFPGQPSGALANLVDPPPGVYTVEAFHRVAPDAAPPSTAYVQVVASYPDGGYIFGFLATPPAGLDWTAAQSTITVTPGATKLTVAIAAGVGSDAGACVLYDNLTLVRQ